MANAETLRVVDPLEYNRAFLTKGVRPDGRALLRGRKAVPHGSPITSAEGSALLRLGETAVLVGVQCEPTAPSEMEPTQGRIVVGVDVAAVSSPASSAAALGGFGGGGGGGRLEREGAVEFLQRGEWRFDRPQFAVCRRGRRRVVVVLRRLRCSTMVIYWTPRHGDDAGIVAREAAERQSPAAATLVQKRPPLGATTGRLLCCRGGDTCCPLLAALPNQLWPHRRCDGVRPNADEEALISTSLTLLLDGKGEMVVTHKPGGAPLPEGSMEACLEAARRRLPALRALVQQ